MKGLFKLIRLAFLIVIVLLHSCKKEELPTLTTTAVTNITGTTATIGGTITDEGSSTILTRGVCWSTGTFPTMADNKTIEGAGAGSFTSNISGLKEVTTYFVRAYATNDAGTSYGNENSFTTNLDTPTITPYFALPATGVSILVGTNVTIYGDALINVPIVNNLAVSYTCDIGSASGNNYVINPVTSDIGNHTLVVLFKNGSTTIITKTITLTVAAKVTAGGISILRVGDSTMDGEGIGAELDLVLAGVTITYLGTQGTTRKHEGYPGHAFEKFATNASSPFRKAGVLDIAAYFTDNSIAIPDIVYFRLGINDLFPYRVSDITDANITTILGYVDTLVDGFLAYNGDLKIIIALPTICKSDFATWVAEYATDIIDFQNKYIEIVHRWSVALTNKYANGIYSARVDCSYEVINVDRVNDYANALHPDASGDVNLGLGLAPYINKYLK